MVFWERPIGRLGHRLAPAESTFLPANARRIRFLEPGLVRRSGVLEDVFTRLRPMRFGESPTVPKTGCAAKGDMHTGPLRRLDLSYLPAPVFPGNIHVGFSPDRTASGRRYRAVFLKFGEKPTDMARVGRRGASSVSPPAPRLPAHPAMSLTLWLGYVLAVRLGAGRSCARVSRALREALPPAIRIRIGTGWVPLGTL